MSSTGTCTCSVVVLCATAAHAVCAGMRSACSQPQLQPRHPCLAAALLPSQAQPVQGREATAAAVLSLGHGFLQFGAPHGEA